MAGKVLHLDEYIIPDALGTAIANKQLKWETFRETKLREWKEVQQYIFATDTTKTSNSKLPWNNKTTLPKLCQIRDNLYANYMATMFPKRKWLVWEGETKEDDEQAKRKTIEDYIAWVIDRTGFKKEVAKLILDYIDYGNCFCMPEWIDETRVLDEENRMQTGYTGPALRRISPVDIVFDPTAPSFDESPKIIRSIVSIGEVKAFIEGSAGSAEEKEEAKKLFQYLKDVRSNIFAAGTSATLNVKDDIYNVSGFTSFREYLDSDYVELLTFYGTLYDREADQLYENYEITVADRHKVIAKKPNPSIFGQAPIYHAGWRVRQDNLWAMGPLDNLVGMQYRVDHLENLKADVFDLIAYPVLKIKGFVEDFDWGPMERILVGDDGDVEMLAPDVAALNANMEISILEAKMEEMAGAPKEAMGFRTPGEKTMYEVQRLENAAARIFQNKVAQFEQNVVEPSLNGMLELSRRFMNSQSIRVFSNDLQVAKFRDISNDDLVGAGRIRPMAAQHFAERANLIQNLTNFYQSAVGQDEGIKQHFSSLRQAKMVEDLLDLQSYNIVEPYVRLSEEAEAQRLMNAQTEEVATEASTPAGLTPDDFDQELL